MREPWKIFRIAKNELPRKTIYRIFGENSKNIEDWATDPRYSDDLSKNPIDAMREFLLELDAAGYGEHASAAIKFISDGI